MQYSNGVKIENHFSHDGIEIFEQIFESDFPILYLPWTSKLRQEKKKVVGSIEVDLPPAFYKPSRKSWAGIEDDAWVQPNLKNRKPQEFGIYWDRICEAMTLTLGGFVGRQKGWRTWDELNAFEEAHSGSRSQRKLAFAAPSVQNLLSRDILVEAVEIDRKRNASDARNLDLAIRRWVGSHVGNREDQLIEFRIALEALYARNTQQEIAMTIATRGAWHLGRTFEERRAYYETLRNLYGDASRVIHAGSVKYVDKDDGLLDRGREACRQAILTILNCGTPDWDKLVLGRNV